MRAVLVSRYPRVDTPAWKRDVARGLKEAGFELAGLYSRARLLDQAQAGFRENGLGVVKRYASLRSGATSAGERAAEPAQTLAAWLEEQAAPVIRARQLDDDDAIRKLRALEPDLLVLAGSDIVPASLLEVPRIGTINPHYGLLPAYRGMNVTEWSVFCGDPVGVTVHLVDPGIDTGDILLREEIPVEPADTFGTLRTKHQRVSARLLVEAAVALRDGSETRSPQAAGDGRQYYRMHPLLRGLAEERLAARASS